MSSAIKRAAKNAADTVIRLLSPKSFEDSSSMTERILPKLQIVMDVDECMLFAYDISENEVKQLKNNSKAAIVWTEGPKSYPLQVCFRPGLKNFLHEVSQFADLYVMTAGNGTYARPLIKLIDPDCSIFKEVITREKFDFKSGKNLEALGEKYDKKRTVLVDNMAMNFSFQRSNGILVREFLGDPYDDQLEYVLELLLSLDAVEDVRDVLEPVCHRGEFYHAFADEFCVWE